MYYLKNSVRQVKVGCIANQLSEWVKIFIYFLLEILFTVSRLPWDFSEEIDYKSSVTSSMFSPKEGMFL